VAQGTVTEVTDRLVATAEAKGMKVFTVIEHSAEAQKVGLTLRDTKVVIFGSPSGGTPVMMASPLAALDLPLKVLVWDDHGQTTVSYTSPPVLADRYHLSPELAARLEGIGPLTDSLLE
jgi:uncharacterized protein (DUF302 family)